MAEAEVKDTAMPMPEESKCLPVEVDSLME